MNLKEIKDLIDLVSEKGFAEFEIERQGFRLRISRFKEAPQVIHAAPAPVIISSGIPGATEVLASGVQRALTEGGSSATPNASGTERAPEVEVRETEGELRTIKSPIVGTFYRASSPTSEPFVRIGDHVEPDTVVCIIEAMKLMNEIQAEVSGEVVKILVENGHPVEYGQALIAIRTS